MKVKILETRNIIGYNSKEFRNYQVSFKEKKVLISELDYTKYPDLLSFEDEYIILKEPVRDNFIINEKENKNGKFLTLIPKQTGSINIVEDRGNSDISTNRKSNQSNTEALNRDGNSESEIIFDYLDMLGGKGKLFESLDLAIFSINQLKYDDFECIENFRIHRTLGKGVFDNPKIIQLIKQQINRVVGVLKNNENDIQKVKSIIETNSDTATSSDETNFIGKTRVKLNIIQSIIEKTTSSKTDMGIIVWQGKRLRRNFEFIKDQLSIVLEETKAFNSLKFNLESHKQVQGLSRLDDFSDKFTFRVEENTITMYDEIIQELTEKGKVIDRLLGSVTPNIVLPDEAETKKETQVLSATPKDKTNRKKNTSPKQVAKHQENKKNVNRVENSAKVSFINGLLKISNRKDVSEKTRERVIDLVSKEAVGNDLVLKEIQNDVNEIKKYIIKTPEPPTNTKQPILHNPKTLVEYLYKFSFDENLKWLTHEKENHFDYVIILDEAKKTFESFKKILIPKHTYFNIQNFIIGNKDKKFPSLKLYGNKNIYLDWSTEEVLEWCKENPGVYPNDMPIPKEKQYPIANNKNFMLLKFGDVIKEFKHYIEIRTDDEQRTLDLRLSDLMRRLGLYTDFNKPEFNELFKSVNVYTDTYLLFQGFEQIFNWCFDHRAKSNRIDISIESENEFYTLKIKHIGSKIGYEKDSSKLNGLGGDLNKVRNLFFNICDWEIHAKLSDGKTYRIELLNSNVNTLDKPSLITEIEPVDGVIYIVKLYKTVNL